MSYYDFVSSAHRFYGSTLCFPVPFQARANFFISALVAETVAMGQLMAIQEHVHHRRNHGTAKILTIVTPAIL
jgi:hypothetical protein